MYRSVRSLFTTAILLSSCLTWAEVLSNPYFYTITSSTGKKSFLFGTLHGGVSKDDIPGFVFSGFLQSKTFLTEWAFTENEVKSALSNQIVKEQLKTYRHKGDTLTPDEIQRLIVDWGVDARLAQKAKSNDCSLLSFGGPMATGFMDFHFIDLARKQKKKLVALDTEEKLNQLAAQHPSKPCDIRKIMTQISPAQFKLYQLEMIQDYRNGTVAEETGDNSIMNGRNEFWMPKILKEIDQGTTFIAVGCAHLHGPKGLIELLQKNGYTVTKITF